MLGLGGMEFGLGLASELLATVVADKTAGFLAWLQFGSLVVTSLCLCSLDLLERLVLVIFEPFESALYC